MNPYVPILARNLPRLLALFNADETDPYFGCGDRRYWAWKLIDFPNATFQGAALGLARMLAAGHLPGDATAIRGRIEAMIAVLPRLMDRNGGLAEALPNEGSFCVTGLVLGDCLGALAVLGDPDPKLVEGMAPMARFLMRQDEHHGIISNHLASTALGMARWAAATGERAALDRSRLWIDRIRANASDEGWMREYGGADPGYQSWCTSALAQLAEESPIEVEDLLARSFAFMERFANPDGSFANGCGARMTRFLFPGGAEVCADRFPAAARLAAFAQRHVGANRFVTLDAIDEPNLAPLFNDFALAASRFAPRADLPEPRSADFPLAGLRLVAEAERLVCVNIARGWVSASTPAGTRIARDPAARRGGRVLRPVNGRIVADEPGSLTIEADLVPTARMMPSALKFTVLRALSLTIFRSPALGNFIKRGLARLLMGQRTRSLGRISRRIDLSTARVEDRVVAGKATLIPARGFSPMHMASQGYWQVSDDSAPES